VKSTDNTVLVIGGGPAGMEAALKAAGAGLQVVLVDKEQELGGLLRQLQGSFPDWGDPSEVLRKKKGEIDACPNIEVRTGAQVAAAERRGSGFVCRLEPKGELIDVGAVIIATGFGLFDCSRYGEYGCGIYPGVLTSLEFEARLKAWGEGDRQNVPETVGFIQCVGSRDRSKGHPYCSKICCMYTAKQAGMFRDLFPASRCYVFYIDIRAAGKSYEEFVRKVIEEKKVRYFRGRPGKVLPSGGRLLVRSEDTLMGVPIEVETDMVVLAPAVVPGPETERLLGMFGASEDSCGFPQPLEESMPQVLAAGVFMAGGCGFAVTVQEAITQGAAAAAEVLSYTRQKGAN
jgi:heterodisulfide reductase subunit A2